MKKTQFIELLATIKGTFVSFFSIMMFVALGMAIFLGITWGPLALETNLQKIYDSTSFHNFEIAYAYGLTDSNLTDISQIEGVSDVEGGYSCFTTFKIGDVGYVAQVQSLGEHIDVVECDEGVLPQDNSQIAVEKYFAQAHGIEIGDTITFDKDSSDASDTDGMQYLNGSTYTVSAIVTNPSYLPNSKSARGVSNKSGGSVDCIMMLKPSAFDSAAYDGSYSNVSVSIADSNALNTFDSTYSSVSNQVKQELTDLGQTDAAARFAEIKAQMQAKIDNAQTQIDAGQSELDEKRAAYESEVASARDKLASALSQLQSGQAQYESGLATYNANHDSAVAKLEDAQNKVDKLNQALDTGVPLLEKAQDDADVAKAEYDAAIAIATTSEERQAAYDAFAAKLRAIGSAVEEQTGMVVLTPENYQDVFAMAWDEVAALQEQASEGQAQIDDGWDQLNSAKANLDSAKNKLDSGWDEYYAGVDELESTIVATDAQITDAENKLASAKDELDQKKAQLDGLAMGVWSISDRSENIGQISAVSLKEAAYRVRISLASLFLIVGLLVCYSAVSRIVKEQTVNIGTKKALGLRGREITLSFLLYSALAVVLGTIIGALAGCFIVEQILNNTIAGHYSFGNVPLYFSLPDTLLFGLIELVLICLATWLACRRMLKKQATELLRGVEPPKGTSRFYEKWTIWQRMPIFSQSIVNNIFNDKGRVFGTLIGIAGCTALVVTALTLSDNVQQTFEKQYADVYAYTSSVVLDTSYPEAAANVTNVLSKDGVVGVPITRQIDLLYQPDGALATANVIVPQDADELESIFHLESSDGFGEAALSDGGVWVSAAYANHMGAKVGDTITIADSSSTRHELRIDGFFNYYLNYNEVIMTPKLYEQTFSKSADPNTILLEDSSVDSSQVEADLLGTPGFFKYVDEYSNNKLAFDDVQSILRVLVFVYLLISVLMAFLVLLNLNAMFIEEKKRDLIVLMINGFSVKDAKRYIYRDNIIMTIVGTILGVLIGMLVGYLSVKSMEFNADFYVSTPSLIACLAGIVASVVFSTIVSIISLRKIPRFKLTEIDKM